MGRWAQAQRRGTVAPGETVGGSIPLDPDCIEMIRTPSGGNTAIIYNDYTCGDPGDQPVAIEFQVSNLAHTQNFDTEVATILTGSTLGTLMGGSGTLSFEWIARWTDGSGHALGPFCAVQTVV